jgi:hypothetical protein
LIFRSTHIYIVDYSRGKVGNAVYCQDSPERTRGTDDTATRIMMCTMIYTYDILSLITNMMLMVVAASLH